MFRFLNSWSHCRSSWLLLFISAVIFECIALYFQHVMQLSPCTLCIYQRCAIFGVMLAALIAICAPTLLLIRLLSLGVWIYSSWQGLSFAREQTSMQLNPSPFATCELFVQFPDFLPLNKWLPSVFEAYGDCALKQWAFMSLEMPQWMIIIFVIYLSIAGSVLFSQFLKQDFNAVVPPNNNLDTNNRSLHNDLK